MNIGLLLSGCGVYDGAEIHESVLSLLVMEQQGWTVTCIGLDKNQHHVINHLTGEEMPENRNMMIEAARIARGNIVSTESLDPETLDALVLPGGFGCAKNFTRWAFEGSAGPIDPAVKKLIQSMHARKIPLVALCVSPVVIAKAFEDTHSEVTLTVGHRDAKSPYNQTWFTDELVKTGVRVQEKTHHEISIDEKNKVICAPCYMMEASVLEIYQNIQLAMEALKNMLIEP
jgi:enhancing lycopene biosynthesis protein 2